MIMKKYLLLVLLAGFGLSSCSDDEEPTGNTGTTQKSTQELIQHKWDIESIVDINFKGATTEVDEIDTLDFIQPGDYIEFLANNKVVVLIDGDLDTSDYNLINETAINFDGDAFDITDLTESRFVMTYKERVDTPYFDNIVTLKR